MTRTARAGGGLFRDGVIATARAVTGGTATPGAGLQAARAVRRLGPTPAALVALSAVRFPDKPALVDDAGSLTYAELHDRASAVARGLHSTLGSTPGALAILCRNSRTFAIALLAGAQLGRELLYLNTEFSPAQLAAVLDRHDPAILIHDEEYRTSVEQAEFRGRAISATSTDGGMLTDLDVDMRHPQVPPVRGPVRMTMLTSGTTGLAKGVSRSIGRRPLAELALSTLAVTRLSHRDVTLVAPPFFHAFGLVTLLGTLGLGGTVVCHARFDADQTLLDAERHRATVFAGVPVMFQRLLRAHGRRPDAATGSLRLAITGGAKITATVVAEFIEAFGPIVANGYGSTEVGLVTLARPSDLAEDPRSLGRPTLGIGLRILREDRTPAEGSEIGTIFVRGGVGFDGYVADARRDEQAKEVVDGYVSTGDRGFLDSRGRLRIADREDDMVVSGGENIFPGEVQAAIDSHPLVLESAVIAAPDEEYGQVLHAFVTLTDPAAELAAADLKAYLADRLERYKQPKRFAFVPELPRNATGKVLRSALQTLVEPDEPAEPAEPAEPDDRP